MQKLREYIERINRMDALIRRKATGSPAEFAVKMNMSERRLYQYLAFMKGELKAPILYNKLRKCYQYRYDQELTLILDNI